MSATIPTNLATERNCYLTTTGRVSGNPHEIEIWFAVDHNTVYMLSGNKSRSDWVKNVRHNAQVAVRIGTSTWTGHARIIDAGSTEEQHAREIIAGKYEEWKPGDPFSEWASTSLPVAIELDK